MTKDVAYIIQMLTIVGHIIYTYAKIFMYSHSMVLNLEVSRIIHYKHPIRICDFLNIKKTAFFFGTKKGWETCVFLMQN
jgi:hypothetical protein